ncbi:hypothetical protein VP01_27g3 [Puccinia sorghi]|uniref:Uncharacterized protein n=1 Tax=Puccinia sorghi TaxID=27349 RepID=A0A0L6V2J9_9BASI|nr:hypothetical protein VP01_27g3 [Puccinia sorghi]
MPFSIQRHATSRNMSRTYHSSRLFNFTIPTQQFNNLRQKLTVCATALTYKWRYFKMKTPDFRKSKEMCKVCLCFWPGESDLVQSQHTITRILMEKSNLLGEIKMMQLLIDLHHPGMYNPAFGGTYLSALCMKLWQKLLSTTLFLWIKFQERGQFHTPDPQNTTLGPHVTFHWVLIDWCWCKAGDNPFKTKYLIHRGFGKRSWIALDQVDSARGGGKWVHYCNIRRRIFTKILTVSLCVNILRFSESKKASFYIIEVKKGLVCSFGVLQFILFPHYIMLNCIVNYKMFLSSSNRMREFLLYYELHYCNFGVFFSAVFLTGFAITNNFIIFCGALRISKVELNSNPIYEMIFYDFPIIIRYRLLPLSGMQLGISGTFSGMPLTIQMGRTPQSINMFCLCLLQQINDDCQLIRMADLFIKKNIWMIYHCHTLLIMMNIQIPISLLKVFLISLFPLFFFLLDFHLSLFHYGTCNSVINLLLHPQNLCRGASEAEQWSYCCVINWLQHGNLHTLPPFLGCNNTRGGTQ